MFKFSIRETILVTTAIAVLLAWWMDHRQTAKRLTVAESDNRKWQFRAEYLRNHICSAKVGGKWLYPWRIEFDPDTEAITSGLKSRGGEWTHPAGTTLDFEPDWAAVR